MAYLWDAFWGYDLVQQRGLLDRVFTKLGIPETSWQGLKWLPEVAAESGYGTLVQQYRTILDESLKGLPAPRVPVEPLLQADTRGSSSSNLAAAVAEDDEDLARDMKRGHFVSRTTPPSTAAHSSGAEQKKDAALDGWEEEWDPFGTGEGASAPSDKPGSTASINSAAERLQQQLTTAPAAAGSQPPRQTNDAAGASAAAFQCLADLLEACLASASQPQLDDIVKADKASGRVQKVSRKAQQSGADKAPNVRWYDSRGREALQLVADWLRIPWQKMQLYECLLAQQNQVQPTDAPERKELSSKERRMRALKIGAAAAGGGAILAVTGGLAAPALAAVAGTVLTTVGGSAAAAAAVTSAVGSTAGAAAVIAGFGAGGAHVVGGKMARRVGDVKEFGFRIIPDDQNYQSSFSMNLPEASGDAEDPKRSKNESSTTSSSSWSSWKPWSSTPKPAAVPLLPIPVAARPPENPRLSRTIAVAGSVAAPDDFIDLWRGLSNADSERFCLVWETAELIALNSSIVNMLLSQAYSTAGKYVIEKFVIHGLVGAVAMPLTVLNVAGVIDSCWAVVMNRAARAGELLAHLLMSGAHGDCPVTLIGNSMGARLIYYCLLELNRCQCKGVVQNAILLGAPVDVIQERWVMARSVVSGRLVNGFSRKDWVLALGFRARQGTFRPAAGLGEVQVPGVENIDLTGIVHGHGDYVKKMGAVLARLGMAHQP